MMSSKILVSTRTVVSASIAALPSLALATGCFAFESATGAGATFGAEAAALAASFALL